MGKSDPIVLPWYEARMKSAAGKRVAFLAQPGHNQLSRSLMPTESHFLDLSLKNWDINQTRPWDIPEVDAIVCTRGAYFSERPSEFLERCLETVVPGGHVFVDWGLGDHWRFSRFRVGWRDETEHEHAVVGGFKSYLYSAVWNDILEDHPQVLRFKEWISPHGYMGPLGPYVTNEVPSVLQVSCDTLVDCLAIWPERPQLYILTAFQR